MNNRTFKILSRLIKYFVNWFGIKNLLLFNRSDGTLLLFNRFLSRCYNELPPGNLLICSRFFPKKLSLMANAFFRWNCIVVDLNYELNNLPIIWRNFFDELKKTDTGICRTETVFDIQRQCREALLRTRILEGESTSFVWQKLRIDNIVVPFDSYVPVRKLIDFLIEKKVKVHVVQHGLMDYPYRDFLVGDYFYVFSSDLKEKIQARQHRSASTILISEYLNPRYLSQQKSSFISQLNLESLYVITSATPIFLKPHMRTSYCDLIINEFQKTFIELIGHKNEIPVKLVCHPAENIEFYRTVLKSYCLDWTVISGFDRVSRFGKNPLFIDLGRSTVSCDLLAAGAIVFQYDPSASIQRCENNFRIFTSIKTLVQELKKSMEGRIGLYERPEYALSGHEKTSLLEDWIKTAAPEKIRRPIRYEF